MKPKIIKSIDRTVFLLAFGLFFGASPAFAAYVTITNDVWWKDTAGNPIYAQGGGIIMFSNVYYWYGVQYAGANDYYTTGTANSANATFVQDNCYSSTDLLHWTKQTPPVTTATANFNDGASGSLRGHCVFYDTATQQYIMWMGYTGRHRSSAG
jgi:hypothetical protein